MGCFKSEDTASWQIFFLYINYIKKILYLTVSWKHMHIRYKTTDTWTGTYILTIQILDKNKGSTQKLMTYTKNFYHMHLVVKFLCSVWFRKIPIPLSDWYFAERNGTEQINLKLLLTDWVVSNRRTPHLGRYFSYIFFNKNDYI